MIYTQQWFVLYVQESLVSEMLSYGKARVTPIDSCRHLVHNETKHLEEEDVMKHVQDEEASWSRKLISWNVEIIANNPPSNVSWSLLKCSCEVPPGADDRFKHEMDKAEQPDGFFFSLLVFHKTETLRKKRHHAHLSTQMGREQKTNRKKKYISSCRFTSPTVWVER